METHNVDCFLYATSDEIYFVLCVESFPYAIVHAAVNVGGAQDIREWTPAAGKANCDSKVIENQSAYLEEPCLLGANR